jgi:hypothetical protein
MWGKLWPLILITVLIPDIRQSWESLLGQPQTLITILIFDLYPCSHQVIHPMMHSTYTWSQQFMITD